MIRFLLNNLVVETDDPPAAVLLDFIRGKRGLKGTKEACREGDCGACAALIGHQRPDGPDYRAAATCLFPLGCAAGAHVVTIEGLNGPGLTPVQECIVEEGATQCGFCTPGIVVAWTGLLLAGGPVTPEAAAAAAEGHLCRCTGYASIRRAARRLCDRFADLPANPARRLDALIQAGVVPEGFRGAAARAAGLVSDPDAAGAGALALGGGTDLYVQRPEGLQNEPVRLLMRNPALLGIEAGSAGLRVGGAASPEDLLQSDAVRERIPELAPALRMVASQLIRRQSTVAGNLANASPIGDLAVMLLALGARLDLLGPDGERERPLRGFFLAYKRLDLRPGEIIRSVRIPPRLENSRFGFEKVSRRDRLDIASVNCAISLRVEDGRLRDVALAAGGVAPVPLLLAGASRLLEGAEPTAETLRRAEEQARAETAPISDVRGSAAYKRELLVRLIRARFTEWFPAAAGEEPPA